MIYMCATGKPQIIFISQTIKRKPRQISNEVHKTLCLTKKKCFEDMRSLMATRIYL